MKFPKQSVLYENFSSKESTQTGRRRSMEVSKANHMLGCPVNYEFQHVHVHFENKCLALVVLKRFLFRLLLLSTQSALNRKELFESDYFF